MGKFIGPSRPTPEAEKSLARWAGLFTLLGWG